nr:hypothetical protein [Tanacetum cinerariifolium]
HALGRPEVGPIKVETNAGASYQRLAGPHVARSTRGLGSGQRIRWAGRARLRHPLKERVSGVIYRFTVFKRLLLQQRLGASSPGY